MSASTWVSGIRYYTNFYIFLEHEKSTAIKLQYTPIVVTTLNRTMSQYDCHIDVHMHVGSLYVFLHASRMCRQVYASPAVVGTFEENGTCVTATCKGVFVFGSRLSSSFTGALKSGKSGSVYAHKHLAVVAKACTIVQQNA